MSGIPGILPRGFMDAMCYIALVANLARYRVFNEKNESYWGWILIFPISYVFQSFLIVPDKADIFYALESVCQNSIAEG